MSTSLLNINLPSDILISLILIIVAVAYLAIRRPFTATTTQTDHKVDENLMSNDQQQQSSSLGGLKNEAVGAAISKTASVMSPAPPHLDPPKSTPIPRSLLASHAGSDDPTVPIWLAIRGTVFDVSSKREMYGPGGSYHVFAGKDGSRGLAKSSLNVEDAVEDTTGLEPAEERTLQQWYDFFEKRYNIIGKVVEG